MKKALKLFTFIWSIYGVIVTLIGLFVMISTLPDGLKNLKKGVRCHKPSNDDDPTELDDEEVPFNPVPWGDEL